MASAKEIKTKISSVQSTQKITSAMEMVATSKMRKVQERMEHARPYSYAIRNVISHIAKSNGSNKNHKYILAKEVKRAVFVVISTDRGLCGGLNSNLFKRVLKRIKELQEQKIIVDLALVGNKAVAAFGNLGLNIISKHTSLGDTPELKDVLGVISSAVEAYDNDQVELIELFYNNFINTMSQVPTAQKLLPLPLLADEEDNFAQRANWDYIYEPEAGALLKELITRYVESQYYYSILDNIACENAARMIAMKAATDNAGDMIHNLKLVYNKARQASITNELNEIVAGAAVV